ncbi:MAG TPA: phosphatase PAP2 family protein [Gemmatimonadales bacterium]|nr:phosphatase PAP2 family protein [Hyphomicrobiaceae bacterium]HWC74029.1 phosphatase PAP2 family protein [Gemmatimonadales bacterium]
MHHALSRLDRLLLEWLHQHSTPAGVTLFLFISRLGAPEALIAIGIIGAMLLVARREWIVLGGWSAAFAGTALIDHWLKLAVHRPRPIYATTFLHNPTWSFPSGHAMWAVVGYGMLTYVIVLLRRPSRQARNLIVAAATLLVLAIGASRLYLGVHYFTDVAGGYLAGLIWLATCILAVELARRWQPLPQLHPKS